MSDFWWEWRAPIIIVGILVAMFGAFMGLAMWGMSAACSGKWEPAYQPRWDFVTECTILVDGHRIPADNYRVL